MATRLLILDWALVTAVTDAGTASEAWTPRVPGRGYPYGPSAYFDYIDTWRTSGTFGGLEFR